MDNDLFEIITNASFVIFTTDVGTLNQLQSNHCGGHECNLTNN